ncbi:MAG: hypothetical protein IJ594_09920, partial [Oscillospiraceae bacterium]|nr:hypothetical protein [Oscillospiraceae bacterium]
MTAGEVIALTDALRPNQYAAAQKLRWLRRLDGQILAELEETHEPAAQAGEPSLPAVYDAETELLAPFPYDEELYTAYLFCQIDLHNAEIQKYNQSLTLLSAAWRQLADFLNRRRRPRGAARWRC